MKNTIIKILFIIQCLLILSCLVLVVLYFTGNKGLLNIIELIVASDLIILGLNNWIVNKKIKYAILYLVVGGLMMTAVILKMVGVV
jgi:hypothetical protein